MLPTAHPYPPSFPYPCPQIFSLLGLGANVALWNATLVGGAKILGVFIGMWLLDRRMTRRTLLAWGGVTQAAFLIATAIIFAVEVGACLAGWEGGIKAQEGLVP